MASNFKIGVAAQDAACNAIVDLIDVGGPGICQVRTGSPPATPATADSGTLLATCTFSATAFGNSSNGTATANAITSDTSADATGDAGHFRVKQAGGTVILQGTAGNAADTADMTFDNKSIVATGTVAINSFQVTVPTQ